MGVDADAFRKRGRDFVMICHDDVHPQIHEFGDLFPIGDAAVNRDDQVDCRLFRDGLHQAEIQAVTVFPLGDDGQRFDAEFPERAIQNCGGGNPVRIVIAVDQRALALPAGAFQPLHARLHAREQEGIVKAVPAGIQERVSLIRAVQTAREKDLRRFRGESVCQARFLLQFSAPARRERDDSAVFP